MPVRAYPAVTSTNDRIFVFMVVTKGIELRLVPTKAQKIYFNKCIGAERVAYNAMLRTKLTLYGDYGVKDFRPNWSSLKDFYPWMSEVDSRCLNYAKIELERAFKNWYKSLKKGGNLGFPKFKRKTHAGKYHNTSMPNTPDRLFKDNRIFIPVIKWVRFRNYKNLDLSKIKKIRNLTIKRTNTGKYFVSVCCDVEVQEYAHTGNCVGLDLGIKDLIITSSGEKFENRKFLKQGENKIVRLQRVLSKRKKGSKNRDKARLKLAIAYEKLGNKRKDYLHKLTTRLVRENDVICIEDLNVSGMLKNHSLAKSVGDCSFSMIRSMLSYKCDWYGRKFIVIDRWCPTSKRCSHCGHVMPTMGLNVREWVCPKCNTYHDRDINAAKNILDEGLKLLDIGQGLPECKPVENPTVDGRLIDLKSSGSTKQETYDARMCETHTSSAYG